MIGYGFESRFSNMASLESEPKPVIKRQLNPSTTRTSTVHNLTNHFSKLNQNPQLEKYPKYPPPTKLAHTHLQAKNLSKSAVLGQKIVNQGKRVVLESEKEGKKHEEEGKNESVLVKVVKNKQVVKVELGNFLLSNSAKVVSADMPPFIQIHAIGFARQVKDSLEKFTSKALALSLKKEFDGVYGPAWHCIVGSSFGSFVTHSVGGFLYFQLDNKLYVLLFKTTVQRAD